MANRKEGPAIFGTHSSWLINTERMWFFVSILFAFCYQVYQFRGEPAQIEPLGGRSFLAELGDVGASRG